VLSAILRQDSTAEQVTLMHKLAGMTDEERDQLVDEFWTKVSTGWEPPERMVEWWRAARPELPEHPTAAQLSAICAAPTGDTDVLERRELVQ
jgi:hypothetical protein